MAKALLKTGKTACDDLSNDEDPDCILEAILYGKFDDLWKQYSDYASRATLVTKHFLLLEEIVNGQNLQVRF